MLGTLTLINVILLNVHSCSVQSRYEAEPEMHPRPTPASADLQVRPCLLKMFKCERNYVIETSKMEGLSKCESQEEPWPQAALCASFAGLGPGRRSGQPGALLSQR